MENNAINNQSAKKAYHSPVLKDFGKVGDITKTAAVNGGGREDGSGDPQYTS